MSSRTAEILTIPDHTLLRVIGRGSYGEVWLARNVMGTQRAVKIVRRSAFDSDRPYLREFEGIRRCEPVSRAHDGLIDILHMGRHDAEGWFYYVMELADGANGSNAEYVPATLAARLATGARLDIQECLRIAESLTGALAFLHEQGLIHRDVKPSNVLYAGGVPKLGDIGLVAEAGSSRSFVGTEGFVPQEGPGTERADIYALGKVLYEALTGLDREKFPRLPPDWTQAYDFEQRLELNEIVLRACEGDPSRRYHTAREMLADVALVASGRSLKKLRGLERRLKVLRWAGLGTAAVAVLAVGSSWLIQRQADRERTLRHAALLDQVHAARHNPTAGAVTHALRVAAEAAAIQVTPELRDDVIFLLSRPDFLEREDLKIPWSIANGVHAMDAESGLAAEVPASVAEEEPPGPLHIPLHMSGAPDKRRNLTVEHPPAGIVRLEFSRGGARLLLAGRRGGGVVLDTASGTVLASFEPSSHAETALQFCGGTGDRLIRRAANGGLSTFNLPDGSRKDTAEILDWPVRGENGPLQDIWPSPDGKLALLIDTERRWSLLEQLASRLLPQQAARPVSGAACLVEVATGRVIWRWTGADERAAAWSPDGTRIALRSGERIHVLDAVSGTPAAIVPYPLYSRGTVLCFLHDRDHLVFHTWTENGLCELTSGRLLGHPPVAGGENYSVARRLLFCDNGVAEWRPSPVLRTFHPQPLRENRMVVSMPPDDSCLIAGNGESFTAWHTDSAGSTPAAVWPARGASRVVFTPGAGAEFHAEDGIRPAPWTPGAWTTTLPSPLPAPERPNLPNARRGYWFSSSKDGRVRAVGGKTYAVTFSKSFNPEQTRFPVTDASNCVSVSPDGRWIAVGGMKVSGVRVWPAHDPVNIAHEELSGPVSTPSFSPDGKWLAITGVTDQRFLDAKTWDRVHILPRPPLYLLDGVTFTPDGRLCAVQSEMSSCTMIEPGTWNTCFRLHSPTGKLLSNCALSPGGRFFTATGIRQEIFMWDLHAIERELKALGLGSVLP